MSNLLIYNWICYSLDKIPCCYFEVRIKYNNGVQYNKKDVSSDKKKLQTTNELKFYFYPQSSWHVTPKLFELNGIPLLPGWNGYLRGAITFFKSNAFINQQCQFFYQDALNQWFHLLFSDLLSWQLVETQNNSTKNVGHVTQTTLEWVFCCCQNWEDYITILVLTHNLIWIHRLTNDVLNNFQMFKMWLMVLMCYKGRILSSIFTFDVKYF